LKTICIKLIIIIFTLSLIQSLKSKINRKSHHKVTQDPDAQDQTETTTIKENNTRTLPPRTLNYTNKSAEVTDIYSPLASSKVQPSVAPYRVDKCDRMFYIKAKTLPDYDDYSKKDNAFYTFNLFMINILKDSNVGSLVDSIFLDHIKHVPHILRGSAYCVIFMQDDSKKNITMCFEKMENAEQIIESFNKFTRCRRGDNLVELPLSKIKSLLKRRSKCHDHHQRKNKTKKHWNSTIATGVFGKWKPHPLGDVPEHFMSALE